MAAAAPLAVPAVVLSTSASGSAQPGHDGPAAAEFQQVTLAKGEPGTGEPMTMAVLPDRAVLHTSRDGTLRLTDAAGTTEVAGRLEVYASDEAGLQGGKVLRTKVNADGSYDIPAGDLVAPGTERTRPEIYAMGFRNPFRMSVDKATGTAYLGDYGPDAGAASDSRGPGGQVECNRITEPGNFGWPYRTGAGDAYADHDFASETSGGAFDCGAPVNDSPHNTGLTELPPAQPAWIPYDGDSVPEFGGGSESPMAGPVYRRDEVDPGSAVAFPDAYEGGFFAGEFGRQWIKNITGDGSGGVRSINDFPWTGTQVMDMDSGPDGALYVLDYGTGRFGGDENSALHRIENMTGGASPVAEAAADVTSGQAPLAVRSSSDGTTALYLAFAGSGTGAMYDVDDFTLTTG